MPIGPAPTSAVSTDGVVASMLLPVKTGLVISPQSGIINVGRRFGFQPSMKGGSWQYDASYVSESGGVFTALKAGTTRITYTHGAKTAYADIDIQMATLPITGQCLTLMWVLLSLGLCAGVACLYNIKKGTACLKSWARK